MDTLRTVCNCSCAINTECCLVCTRKDLTSTSWSLPFALPFSSADDQGWMVHLAKKKYAAAPTVLTAAATKNACCHCFAVPCNKSCVSRQWYRLMFAWYPVCMIPYRAARYPVGDLRRGKIMDCPLNADEKHTRLELGFRRFSFLFSFFSFFQLCSQALECPSYHKHPSYHKQSGKQIPRRRSADISLNDFAPGVFFLSLYRNYYDFLSIAPSPSPNFSAMTIRSNGIMHY